MDRGAPGNCINLAEMPSVTNTIRRSLIASLLAVTCASCASRGYESLNTLGVLPPQQPAPLWLGTVHSSGNTPITGAAAVTPSQTPGWAHVLISLGDISSGATYAWSLRSGNCEAHGGVIGPADRYANFTIHADGSGAAEAVVPLALSTTQTYAVVATPVAPSVATTACADLTRRSM